MRAAALLPKKSSAHIFADIGVERKRGAVVEQINDLPGPNQFADRRHQFSLQITAWRQVFLVVVPPRGHDHDTDILVALNIIEDVVEDTARADREPLDVGHNICVGQALGETDEQVLGVTVTNDGDVFLVDILRLDAASRRKFRQRPFPKALRCA